MAHAIPPVLRSWLDDACDWGATDLGPIDSWCPDLTSAVASCLPLGPVAVLWGPRLLRVYGPDYAPVLGDLHPGALGRPAPETWTHETWEAARPYLERARETGDPTRADLDLVVDRAGRPERVSIRATYVPIRSHDRGEVLGIAVTAVERTSDLLMRSRAEALSAMATVSVEKRSRSSVARRSMTAALTATGDLLSLAVVLRGEQPQVEPQPPVEGFARLVGEAGSCYEKGCIQPSAGCRFAELDTPMPTEDDVAQRAIGLWPDGTQAAGECRKLPGKTPTDDVGRLVVALDVLTRQDDRQHVFLARCTDSVARAARDSRAEAAERVKVENLEVALESNRTIGAAMGVLMALRHVTPNEAFDLLRGASQSRNRKLRDIAEDVLRTGALP